MLCFLAPLFAYTSPQAYFEQHKVPPSVVLKIMAYVTASTATQASVLRCFCPDVSAYADAAVVQQARAFAACLLQHPPVPEFAEWVASCSQQETDTENLPAAGQGRAASDTDPEPESESFESAVGTAAERQMQREHPVAFSMLMRVWLIWVMNGHSFQKGSALFDYGSKLTHTCACPNTMYRTAAGAISSVVESVDGSSGSNSGLQQPLPPGGPPVEGGGTAAAGAHLALQHISTGDLLTTNYLGMGHKRLMSTPARQSYLQDKFLFKCTCHRWGEATTAVCLPACALHLLKALLRLGSNCSLACPARCLGSVLCCALHEQLAYHKHLPDQAVGRRKLLENMNVSAYACFSLCGIPSIPTGDVTGDSIHVTSGNSRNTFIHMRSPGMSGGCVG
jgi:hypothetical protein